jgi:hypothetical protein
MPKRKKERKMGKVWGDVMSDKKIQYRKTEHFYD